MILLLLQYNNDDDTDYFVFHDEWNDNGEYDDARNLMMVSVMVMKMIFKLRG